MKNELNVGIIKTVQWLNSHGFKTTDSGDGKTHDYECDMDCPYVHIETDASDMVNEALRLKWLLINKGIITTEFTTEECTDPAIQVTWNPAWDKAMITLYNVML